MDRIATKLIHKFEESQKTIQLLMERFSKLETQISSDRAEMSGKIQSLTTSMAIEPQPKIDSVTPVHDDMQNQLLAQNHQIDLLRTELNENKTALDKMKQDRDQWKLKATYYH